MPGPHDKLIADAARRTLNPLGLRRKGQSRLWLGDRGWWLMVVEFQPSSSQKGSFLNVAAHWLWSDSGHLSFDHGAAPDWGSRVAAFEPYRSDDQFRPAAERLAVAAASEAEALAQRIGSIDAAAELALCRERGLPAPSRGSWGAYHAGVAAGLADRTADAETMLRSTTDGRVRAASESMLALLPDASAFRAAVNALVEAQREALRLPRATLALF